MRDVTFPPGHPAAIYLASRQRWLGTVTGMAVLLVVLGVLYLTGAFITTSPAYAVMRVPPGGLQTHGAAMALLGVAELWAISPAFNGHPEREKAARRLLVFGIGPYLGWTSLAFLCSPLVHGGAWNAGWPWPMFGSFVAYLLAVKRYPRWSEVDAWMRSHSRRSGD